MTEVSLKRLVTINQHSLPEDTDPNFQFRYVDIGTIGRGVLLGLPNELRFADSPSRARRLVRAGDTIVSTVRTYLRAVWSVEEPSSDLVVSTGFAVLTPGPQIDPRYLGWLAQSDLVVEDIAARSTGVSYPAISAQEIAEVRVPVIGLSAQRRIADYLEGATDKIDGLITKKRRMLALLEERADARIRHRIAGSKLVRVDNSSDTILVKQALLKLSLPSSTQAEMVTAFRDGQVTARSLRRESGYTESWTEGARLQGVRADDVVVHGLDGFAGAIGTSESDGVCSPAYHVCEPRSGGDAVYLGRMLRILAVSGYLGLFASSTRERAVDFRNWDLFGRIPIPDVEPTEQREVGDLLRKIAPLRDAVDRSARLATERRQALITAAVTGALDIPGAA